MSEPLLFVCKQEGPGTSAATVRFVTLESPTGPVFMAFGSLEMASAIAAFYGVGAGVFLLPETELTAELVGSLTEQRVVVLDSARDYNGATGNEPGFPWPDRVIAYDFVGALRRQSAT